MERIEFCWYKHSITKCHSKMFSDLQLLYQCTRVSVYQTVFFHPYCISSLETLKQKLYKHRMPFMETFTHTHIHLCLQPLSAKCQPDKSQGLRVKWNINILTNWAESQERIILSSPNGDDFISVLPCFTLLSAELSQTMDVLQRLNASCVMHIFSISYGYYELQINFIQWTERTNSGTCLS